MTICIHWFRRDLRLHDNPALAAASRKSGGQVIPLFILDDTILRAPDTAAARVAFLLDALRALDHALRTRGSRLIVRHGRPLDVLRELALQSDARGVYFNRDYTSLARARDEAARVALQAQGIEVRSFKDAMLVEPDEVQTKSGTPYSIYTPYSRQWRACIAAQPLGDAAPLPALAPPSDAIESLAIPSAVDLGFSTAQLLPVSGEAAGLAQLAAFTRLTNTLGIGGYHESRDLPALAATSRLSPYLRFGCIAPLDCLRAALATTDQATNDEQIQGANTWLGQLAWRDFYYQILAHFPHVLDGAFKRDYNVIAWENSEWLFHAWCAGRTGYPIVDAAMRQLNKVLTLLLWINFCA